MKVLDSKHLHAHTKLCLLIKVVMYQSMVVATVTKADYLATNSWGSTDSFWLALDDILI